MTETCKLQAFCNLFAQQAGEDPTGTANSFDTYLMVTVPLPWSSDVMGKGLYTTLGSLFEQAGQQGLKVRGQGIAPEPEDAGLTRLICYQRPLGPCATYQRQEFLIPEAELSGLAHALVFSGDLTPWAQHQVHSHTRDWFLCTHGSVDSACGKFGIPLYQHIKGLNRTDVRIFRTTHFGGHRFAPTLLDFPEGRVWAHLSPLEAEGLLDHSLTPVQAGKKLRGWMGADLFGQLLERAALEHFGWPWLSFEKEATTLEVLGGDEDGRKDPKFADHPPPQARASIWYRTPEGVEGTVEGTILWSHTVQTLSSTGSTETLTPAHQYRVSQLEVRPLP